jgi:lincosamide nucleotidyltransferase A/C/D/E
MQGSPATRPWRIAPPVPIRCSARRLRWHRRRPRRRISGGPVGVRSCLPPRCGMLTTVEAVDVLAVLDLLDERGIYYWVDGGWGVDCLLGEHTRAHDDLDLVVPRMQVDPVRSVLTSRGYSAVRNWLPTAIAFRDSSGREVDLHPVDSTADGGGDQVLEDGSIWHYAAPVQGSIEGRPIRCSSAEDQLLMHQGYEPRPVDHADMRRIIDRFGLPAPPPFDGTVERET